jgi:hypothetical protein
MQHLMQQFQAAAARAGLNLTPQQLQQLQQGTPTQTGPMMGLQQMMPVNYSIPQYLTVREERRPGEGIFSMLGRELFRSVGKSLGHTLGNFFDTTPLFWKEPPG